MGKEGLRNGVCGGSESAAADRKDKGDLAVANSITQRSHKQITDREKG